MSYEDEAKALMDKYLAEFDKACEKYKGFPGKDGPLAVEQRRISELFHEELKLLKKKYARP